MLRDAGAHFGLGCGGASVADLLVNRSEPAPTGLAERLLRPRMPIAMSIGGRAAMLHLTAGGVDTDLTSVPVRVGKEACLLHLSAGLIDWLGQPLELEGALIDEDALPRALLLELAALDFIRQIEARVGEIVRYGEEGEGNALHALDLAIDAEGKMLPLRIELTERLAEKLADVLDDLQPPRPADHSGVTVDLVVEAGSQDLCLEEVASLSPGDVVMLANTRPVAVLNGALVAAVRRQAEGVELDGPFYPRSRRAMAGSLADIQSGAEGAHLVHMVAESARVTTNVGAVDALRPRDALPLSVFDETGVDLVIDNRRFGRGELIMIGAGLGVRIVSLLPEAVGSQTS
jgi:type III secretion protein Q